MGVEDEIRDMQTQRSNVKGAALTGAGSDFDQDLYGGSKSDAHLTELPTEAEEASMGADQGMGGGSTTSQRRQYSGPSMGGDHLDGPGDEDPFAARDREMGVAPTIAERESDYQAQRRNRIISPARTDPFAAGGTADPEARSYKDVMTETALANERVELMAEIKAKKEEEAEAAKGGAPAAAAVADAPKAKKRRRWDVGTDETPVPQPGGGSEWDKAESAPSAGSRWDATPTPAPEKKANRWDETPVAASGSDETPAAGGGKAKRSRWDETPVGVDPSATPVAGFNAAAATPFGAAEMATPVITAGMDPAQVQSMRWEQVRTTTLSSLDTQDCPLTHR
eukprot:COSAG05_NODE_3635_length_1944_cov_1.441734_2_plen_338_part_00